ncbi:PAS domain S-box protein [Paracraurococcus lichenis]|uniref:histidine kinase n=1 Tax=Paracraurococcus lichenis TaxID=3064888 RepID=A0ABT9E8E5_9PROT|nr:PAS domain S-box protein [Paracraurococcus sp. LOR1-02]MDO9712215.1 PAS domain S-box protein [Paracraurococcus sp. LOR1-02]
MVLGLSAAHVLARRVVRPIGALVRRAQAVASGTPLTRDANDADAPVAITEIADLRAWMATAEEALLRRSEALAEQNRTLGELAGTLDLGMAMVRDWDGPIRFWSRGCELLYGWSAAEVVGRDAHDLLRTVFPVPFPEIKAALEHDGEWTGDLRHCARDGREVVVAVRKALRRDQAGRPVAVLESVADVTAAREAEAALRDSEATLRAVLDALPVGVIIANVSGRILKDNAAHRELWGVPPDTTSWEAYGEWVGYRPETGERIQAHEWAMARALLKGETTHGELVECARFGTGERRFFLNSAAPVRDARGRIVGGVVAEVDVTPHRKAEAALAESEARLRSVVNTAADGILVADAAGRIVSANASVVQMFGYDAEEDLLGRDLGTLMPQVKATTSGERPSSTDLPRRELTAARRDGSEFPVELSVSSFASGGQRFSTSVVRDVTERKRAEELRNLLAREVDHRAKNALAVALSLLRLTPRDDAARFAASVEGRVTAMARAHSLLATQKWEGADLRALVEAELAAHVGRLSLSGPAVRLSPEAVQPMAMVLHELATNATKYGALSLPAGHVVLSWDTVGTGNGLRLVWQERGGPPVQAPTRRGFGSRLLTSLVVQQLGGDFELIWTDTGLHCEMQIEPRFLMSTAPSLTKESSPRASIEERRVTCTQQIEQTNHQPAQKGVRPRVLVVEDEALLSLEIESALDELGCDVVGPARTLADAVRLAAGERPLSAAVLDVNLGGGDYSFPAVDLLQTRNVPYVLATGYGSARWLEGREHDAVAVLIKPYPREALAGAVRAALHRAAQSQVP